MIENHLLDQGKPIKAGGSLLTALCLLAVLWTQQIFALVCGDLLTPRWPSWASTNTKGESRNDGSQDDSSDVESN